MTTGGGPTPTGVGSTTTGGEAGTTQAAASAWNGMLLARIIAPDGAALRRSVIAALAVLRAGRPLPRVWMC